MMVPAAERTGMEAEKKEGENNEEDGDRDGRRWRQGTKKINGDSVSTGLH